MWRPMTHQIQSTNPRPTRYIENKFITPDLRWADRNGRLVDWESILQIRPLLPSETYFNVQRINELESVMASPGHGRIIKLTDAQAAPQYGLYLCCSGKKHCLFLFADEIRTERLVHLRNSQFLIQDDESRWTTIREYREFFLDTYFVEGYQGKMDGVTLHAFNDEWYHHWARAELLPVDAQSTAHGWNGQPEQGPPVAHELIRRPD